MLACEAPPEMQIVSGTSGGARLVLWNSVVELPQQGGGLRLGVAAADAGCAGDAGRRRRVERRSEVSRSG